jgi:hypothetical protein
MGVVMIQEKGRGSKGKAGAREQGSGVNAVELRTRVQGKLT